MKLIGVLAMVGLIGVLGCGKKDEAKGGGDKAKSADKADPGDAFALEQAQQGIGEIKAALDKGEDPKYKCAASESYASDLKSEAGLAAAAELKKLCGYQAPLAAAKKAVEAAEKARAEKPEENPLSECFSADWDMNIETLKKDHAADPEVQDLEKRWSAACPK